MRIPRMIYINVATLAKQVREGEGMKCGIDMETIEDCEHLEYLAMYDSGHCGASKSYLRCCLIEPVLAMFFRECIFIVDSKESVSTVGEETSSSAGCQSCLVTPVSSPAW
jgi:hypothetical protein